MVSTPTYGMEGVGIILVSTPTYGMEGMGRRVGLYSKIHKIFSEEWRSEDAIILSSEVDNNRELKLGLGPDASS